MDRRVTPPKRVTLPTWGPPPPCKQALKMCVTSLLCSPRVDLWVFCVNMISPMLISHTMTNFPFPI